MQFEAIGTPKPDFYYGGEHGDWLVTLGQHRDSDAAERSNWRYITERVMELYPDDTTIESMGHWAVGWVESFLVKPDSPAVQIMSDWADTLAVYPIADDDDFSLMEWEENHPNDGHCYADEGACECGLPNDW